MGAGSLLGFVYKITNPIYESFNPRSNHQKAPSPNLITLGEVKILVELTVGGMNI
jgi:hypothetical protein